MSQTQEKLVQTAAQLFYEHGYNATGVAAILKAANVNPGSFYHAFPSKQALLNAVLDWYADNLHPIVIDPIVAKQPNPIERVFDLLDWYRKGLTANGARGCPIGNLALELSDTHPDIRPHIDRNLRAWANAIQTWLEEAAQQLPPDTDRHALSIFILTVMEGGLMQARAAASLEPFDDSVAVLRDHINRLLEDAAQTNT